jgi:hypothetical protein
MERESENWLNKFAHGDDAVARKAMEGLLKFGDPPYEQRLFKIALRLWKDREEAEQQHKTGLEWIFTTRSKFHPRPEDTWIGWAYSVYYRNIHPRWVKPSNPKPMCFVKDWVGFCRVIASADRDDPVMGRPEMRGPAARVRHFLNGQTQEIVDKVAATGTITKEQKSIIRGTLNDKVSIRSELYRKECFPDVVIPDERQHLVERLRERQPTLDQEKTREFNIWLLGEAFSPLIRRRPSKPRPVPGPDPEVPGGNSGVEDTEQAKLLQEVLRAIDAVRFRVHRDRALAFVLRSRYPNIQRMTYKDLARELGLAGGTVYPWDAYAKKVLGAVFGKINSEGGRLGYAADSLVLEEDEPICRVVLLAFWVRRGPQLLCWDCSGVDVITKMNSIDREWEAGALLSERFSDVSGAPSEVPAIPSDAHVGTLAQRRGLSVGVAQQDLEDAVRLFKAILLIRAETAGHDGLKSVCARINWLSSTGKCGPRPIELLRHVFLDGKTLTDFWTDGGSNEDHRKTFRNVLDMLILSYLSTGN